MNLVPRTAYPQKEQFFTVLESKGNGSARTALSPLIMAAQSSGLAKFIDCENAMVRWSVGILNSFDCLYTNGFTEGTNEVKVLKRNAFGYAVVFAIVSCTCSITPHKKEQLDATPCCFLFGDTPTIGIEPIIILTPLEKRRQYS